jgi:PKHD-type hydroxylase
MNLKNYYWWFDSIIPSRICDDIVKYGISQNSQLAITGNFQGIEKLSSEQEKDLKKLRDSKVSFLTEPWIFKEIHPFINQANKNAEWNFEWSDSESCQFTKYGLNQHYDWHCDSWTEPYKDPPWRKGLIRKLSAIVALSNSSEYVGGDLEFDLRYQEKPKIVICKELKNKGSMVVFPSFVWHRVKPVTEGTRYSLVAWNLGQPYV